MINFFSNSGSHFLKLSNNSIFTEYFIRWSQPIKTYSLLKEETIAIRTKCVWCDIICRICESLRFSVDFLKRQNKVSITYSLIHFMMMFHPIWVNSQIFKSELWDKMLLLKSGTHLSKKLFNSLNVGTLEITEKLPFSIQKLFCSQDIVIFVFAFWLCINYGFIRNIRLISNFVMLQFGSQTITIHTIHILRNISQSKSNQTMKFGQLCFLYT